MHRNPIFADNNNIFSVLTKFLRLHVFDAHEYAAAVEVSHARPPFLSAAAAARLFYDPNGHHAPSTAACYCLPPASSFSQYLLVSCPFPKVPAPFLQTKIIIVLAVHLPTDSYPRHNLHVAESLEGSSKSLRAMYIRTDFVQSSLRRVHPNPRPPSLSPPPTAFLKAYALLSHRPV
ncbi:hypothetical protein K438DRAFT_2021350 [Mycena galopus ATCC 62051]|nr:hypothetical protein K438DRAFT_2021350 [Mycena galopus ATCC 62051]